MMVLLMPSRIMTTKTQAWTRLWMICNLKLVLHQTLVLPVDYNVILITQGIRDSQSLIYLGSYCLNWALNI